MFPYTWKTVPQMQQWMATMEKSQKTDQENGMVYYIWMCGSWYISWFENHNLETTTSW